MLYTIAQAFVLPIAKEQKTYGFNGDSILHCIITYARRTQDGGDERCIR
jgi:hypothetical protein